ncbi:soluble NSF attachment protein [Chytridium lagenaria]|nr:soluble NSF attachment protein [Chytridium lagenaria]
MARPQALSLMDQAEKKAKYTGWFGSNKLDEASDLYARAANCFKLAKMWKEAGDAFISQANDEASSAYLNASKAFKKTHPLDAINALQQAVHLLTERGRFSAAASNQKQIAEIYESEVGDLEKAMNAYETASEWFAGEDSNAQADACLLKVATFAAELKRYEEAVEKFELVASHSVDNKLTKWSVRDYLFKAGLCVLCLDDSIRMKTCLERYKQMDVTFETTRECKFLQELAEAVEGGDVEQFTGLVVEYDRFTKLDSWKTTLLLAVKKSIADEDLT